MTAAELGQLLLCCPLQDGLWPLTLQQYRSFRRLVRESRKETELDRELTAADLMAIGCGESDAAHILALLERGPALEDALRNWSRQGIGLCAEQSADYPAELRQRLGDDAPAVLFLMGDREILKLPSVGLVGSRDLTPAGEDFAKAVGRMAARNGLALVSGNARGADRTGQEACLREGGCVMAYVAERLTKQIPRRGVLYLCEEPPEQGFSSTRALRRNRLIHAAGSGTYVAQVRGGIGGTWSGTVYHLQKDWSPVYVHADGTAGSRELQQLGAVPVKLQELL